ncbi:MAG: bifunctional YncE family protein/alkaline phosphatase family protein [Candidatus Coatesbacteria bacterium]
MRTLAIAILLLASPVRAVDQATVGPAEDGGIVVSTRQLLHPAGKTLEIGSTALDLALSPDGRTVYVKGGWSVVAVDTKTWKNLSTVWGDYGGSQTGIAVSPDGGRVFVTLTEKTLNELLVAPNRTLSWGRQFTLTGTGGRERSNPLGVAISRDGRTAWVCLSMNNTIAGVDLVTGAVREIPVGIAPYQVVLSADGRTAWVSNWGGRVPKPGETTAKSAGSDVVVDARGIASSGTLSVVDLAAGRESSQIETGLHPAGLALSPDGKRLYVACTNADLVTVIDTAAGTALGAIPVRPNPALPYGSASNAVAVSPDGKTLYVANGGNNAIAVVSLSPDGLGQVTGFIPTPWYPGGVVTDGKSLFISSVKGLGGRNPQGRKDEVKKDERAKWGWSVYWANGAATKVAVPGRETLAAMTRRVLADGRVPQILKAYEKSRTGVKPVPVPARTGEPSVFEHVVYVIKENRTYDQVLGDMAGGNGEPRLCIFGRKVTPNHHAIAEQFVLLDNYYCNGVLSSDGHAWAIEANASGYLEKATAGWTRTYNFGTDPLAFSTSGSIWDNVLSHGLSFRNYGELDLPDAVPDDASWTDFWRGYQAKTGGPRFVQHLLPEHLGPYTSPTYPGWLMRIPDVVRAEAFLKEFAECEARGEWPNFIILYLPNNHTSGSQPGYPTPAAHVADNDLALARCVEAISKSRFWPKTVLFVNEDDPQDGFDHVDGHRSVCLVISPYSRLKRTVKEFYNQTSVIHTIERILGLPPLNQMDAMAPLMTACFGEKPDLTPYMARPNEVPLDQMNPEKKTLAPNERHWAELSERLDFAHVDAANEDTLNRILWHAMRGTEPYPAEWAGPHGRGLKPLGLTLSGEDD